MLEHSTQVDDLFAGQIAWATITEYIPDPMFVVPLAKRQSNVHYSNNRLSMVEHRVGYSGLWAPSNIQGSGMFQEPSFLTLELPEELKVSSSLTLTMWLKLEGTIEQEALLAVSNIRKSLACISMNNF